jgi:hypothetical protein
MKSGPAKFDIQNPAKVLLLALHSYFALRCTCQIHKVAYSRESCCKY